MSGVLLTGGRLPSGEVVDVRCADGLIASVGPPVPGDPLAAGAEIVDVTDYLLLPAFADPHAHLDKAFTADRVQQDGFDLFGAIDAMVALAPGFTHEDFVERATRAALLLLSGGTTAIRTHVDVHLGVGLRGMHALAEVRSALSGLLDFQLVALPAPPLTGREGAENRALWLDALQIADVVGGCPHVDPQPRLSQEMNLEVAADFGKPLDLHTDENTDPAVLHLEALAELVEKTAPGIAVTASHCVSLASQPLVVQQRIAAVCAAAGIGVVTLPQTNLFLQSRGVSTLPARGLTAIGALRSAGVVVAGGGDNLQDPFNNVGRGDPLETASLLVAAGHLSPRDALDAVSGAARTVMGLPVATLAAGSPAEIVAIRADSVGDAVARASSERVVVHRGRVVSRTTCETRFGDGGIPSHAGRGNEQVARG